MSMTTTDPNAQTGALERCGQCGAPAAPDQRYCLNCGFHRRNARDPVSRYLSEASAAVARVAAAQKLAASRRRNPRLGLRAVVALVALALIVGILIGNATAGKSTSKPGATVQHTTRHTTTSAQVKNVTGKSYLQQEQDLPNSVTP